MLIATSEHSLFSRNALKTLGLCFVARAHNRSHIYGRCVMLWEDPPGSVFRQKPADEAQDEKNVATCVWDSGPTTLTCVSAG